VDAGSDEILAWTCSNCPKRDIRQPGLYSRKIFRVRMLRDAGYPFTKNDLTLDEWLDLGKLENFLKTKRPT